MDQPGKVANAARGQLNRENYVRESRIFVETSKSRPTHARLRNRELADEAELVSLSVG